MLPAANKSEADIDRMLDLYFGLFAKNGVTKSILSRACERIAMAPPVKGRGKFFPDPGELFAECKDAVVERAKKMAALRACLAIIDGPSLPPAPERDARALLRDLGQRLKSPTTQGWT